MCNSIPYHKHYRSTILYSFSKLQTFYITELMFAEHTDDSDEEGMNDIKYSEEMSENGRNDTVYECLWSLL